LEVGNESAERAIMNKIPEGCKLIACYTGDGWSLEVHDGETVIAYLAWPDKWPMVLSSKEIQEKGFETT
jgi:hypothetical protein